MIAVIFALCALSAVDAYTCPDNASPTYTPPEYFGDCECNTGFKKATLVCEALADSSEEASKTGCTGAGAWAGSTSMAAWCTANCNWTPSYCPTAMCACTTRRLEGVEKPLLEEDSLQAKPSGRRLTGSPAQTETCVGDDACTGTVTCFESPCLIVCKGHHSCKNVKIHADRTGAPITDVLVTCEGKHACENLEMDPEKSTNDWHISCIEGEDVCFSSKAAKTVKLGKATACEGSSCPTTTEDPWPFVEKLAHCEGYSDKKFGGVDYDPTNSSQLAMCTMFERMDDAVYEKDTEDTTDTTADEKAGQIHFTNFQNGMGHSEKSIKYQNMYDAFQKVARIDDPDDTKSYITQDVWRKFWDSPETYAASGARNTPDSTSTTTSSSGGVSVGVVAACTVAAVGAGIGVGYFGRGRANSATATESTAGEKESEWEKQEANEL